MSVKGNWQVFEKAVSAWALSEKLPQTYLGMANKYFLPIANKIAKDATQKCYYADQSLQKPVWFVGISGANGTGKTTMCSYLKLALEELYNLQCVTVSLDDFYLTRADRLSLAKTVHPLLATRGVPGTHDLNLFNNFLKSLINDSEVHIPKFDKSQDDRLPVNKWAVAKLDRNKTRILLFEGWCVGVSATSDVKELEKPINQLEAEEDPDSVWRRYVNDQLTVYTTEIFSKIDELIYLKVSGMKSVLRNRLLQESKMPKRGMSDTGIRRFVQFYERLILRSINEMPEKSKVCLTFDEEQQVSNSTLKG